VKRATEAKDWEVAFAYGEEIVRLCPLRTDYAVAVARAWYLNAIEHLEAQGAEAANRDTLNKAVYEISRLRANAPNVLELMTWVSHLYALCAISLRNAGDLPEALLATTKAWHFDPEFTFAKELEQQLRLEIAAFQDQVQAVVASLEPGEKLNAM